MSCRTGPYKPTYEFSGFDVNRSNTKMDATKIRFRTISNTTGRDANYKIRWARIIFAKKANDGRANQWNGSVRGKNGGPRVHRAQSWNPRRADVVIDGGPLINYIRLQVQVDGRNVCNSAWKKVN